MQSLESFDPTYSCREKKRMSLLLFFFGNVFCLPTEANKDLKITDSNETLPNQTTVLKKETICLDIKMSESAETLDTISVMEDNEHKSSEVMEQIDTTIIAECTNIEEKEEEIETMNTTIDFSNVSTFEQLCMNILDIKTQQGNAEEVIRTNELKIKDCFEPDIVLEIIASLKFASAASGKTVLTELPSYLHPTCRLISKEICLSLINAYSSYQTSDDSIIDKLITSSEMNGVDIWLQEGVQPSTELTMRAVTYLIRRVKKQAEEFRTLTATIEQLQEKIEAKLTSLCYTLSSDMSMSIIDEKNNNVTKNVNEYKEQQPWQPDMLPFVHWPK